MDAVIQAARFYLTREIATDLKIRVGFRKLFPDISFVNVRPTERGLTEIDETHEYYVSHPTD